MPLTTSTDYGKPSSNNYMLGRGKLRLDFYDDAGAPTFTFTDIGNCTSFGLTLDEETLDHTSSRTGLATVDKTVTLSKSLSGSMTLDEYAVDQLRSFLSATVTESAIGAATYTDEAITVFKGAGGKWVEMTVGGVANENRIRGLTGTAILEDAAGPGAGVYVLGTDYEIDLSTGMLFVTKGGAIDTLTASSSGTVYLSGVSQPAGNLQQIKALQKTTITAALHFTSINAQTGLTREVRFHQCKITANGDLPWISDEFGAMEFNFSAENAGTNLAYSGSPIGTISEFFAS